MAEDSEGISELDADAPIGKNIRQYLDLDECIDSIMKAQADFSLSKNTKGLKVEINKTPLYLVYF
jgi:hypothetical protein